MKPIAKVIVAGCRLYTNEKLIHTNLDELVLPLVDEYVVEVVSGGAEGVDKFGETWANKYRFKVHRFLAEWKKYGNPAGPIRNQKMADFATHLIAFPSKYSRGTRDMIARAEFIIRKKTKEFEIIKVIKI